MALTIGPKVENQGLTANGRLTAAEFNELVGQVKHNTPMPVASEDVIEQMIQDGSIDNEQLYCTFDE